MNKIKISKMQGLKNFRVGEQGQISREWLVLRGYGSSTLSLRYPKLHISSIWLFLSYTLLYKKLVI